MRGKRSQAKAGGVCEKQEFLELCQQVVERILRLIKTNKKRRSAFCVLIKKANECFGL